MESLQKKPFRSDFLPTSVTILSEMRVVEQTRPRYEGSPTRVGYWLVSTSWLHPGEDGLRAEEVPYRRRVLERSRTDVKRTFTRVGIKERCVRRKEERKGPESLRSTRLRRRAEEDVGQK